MNSANDKITATWLPQPPTHGVPKYSLTNNRMNKKANNTTNPCNKMRLNIILSREWNRSNIVHGFEEVGNGFSDGLYKSNDRTDQAYQP